MYFKSQPSLLKVGIFRIKWAIVLIINCRKVLFTDFFSMKTTNDFILIIKKATLKYKVIHYFNILCKGIVSSRLRS